MQCTKPIILTKNLDRNIYPDGLKVPCGKCLACRIQKRKEWSMRCLHEMDDHNDSIFITLTYNDKSLPKDNSVSKYELQKFFKRLRKSLGNRKIRYFACGEYGEKNNRPHYHAIIFGMSLCDEDKIFIKNAWPFCDWDKLKDSPFGIAEPDSIRYVCQYIDKKYSGTVEQEEYINKGLSNVFKISSKGIGKCYVCGGENCGSSSESLIRNEAITCFGVPQTIPRYYLKKLGIDTSEFNRVKSIERERKRVKKFAGKDCLEIEYYKRSSAEEYIKYDKAQRAILKQRDKTLQAKANLKKKKL